MIRNKPEIIKNKILHIRDYYPSVEDPASSPWVYDQVKSLLANRINAVVISPTPYLPEFVRAKPKFYLFPKANEMLDNYQGTEVIRPQYFKFPSKLLLKFNFQNLSKSILRSAEKLKPFALIHAHFGQNGVAALKLKEKYEIPLITSFYGYDSGRLGSLFAPYYKKLAEKGDLFLALSEDMKNDLLHLGFPSEKIKIHHLGINPNQFKPIENNAKGTFVFLVVARLDESKGVQDVIVAFNKIKNPKMQLRIVGDGRYKTKLSSLVDKLGITSQVVFINNFKADKPRHVVIEEMQNSDVVLLTSFITRNGAKEGTPVVLMEGQACRKPCIGTIHAGIPEVIINNKTGFLVAERDIRCIANRMQLLYNDTQLKKDMGDNALSHILSEFNQNIQIKKLVIIYNNLLGKYVN